MYSRSMCVDESGVTSSVRSRSRLFSKSSIPGSSLRKLSVVISRPGFFLTNLRAVAMVKHVETGGERKSQDVANERKRAVRSDPMNRRLQDDMIKRIGRFRGESPQMYDSISQLSEMRKNKIIWRSRSRGYYPLLESNLLQFQNNFFYRRSNASRSSRLSICLATTNAALCRVAEHPATAHNGTQQ